MSSENSMEKNGIVLILKKMLYIGQKDIELKIVQHTRTDSVICRGRWVPKNLFLNTTGTTRKMQTLPARI